MPGAASGPPVNPGANSDEVMGLGPPETPRLPAGVIGIAEGCASVPGCLVASFIHWKKGLACPGVPVAPAAFTACGVGVAELDPIIFP